MIDTMRQVLEAVLERLRYQVTTYLPSILAALIILAGAYVTALVARWMLNRIFKGTAVDRFLRRSGLAFMIDSSGRLRATRVVAETAYWLILLAGFLTGLSAFNTDLTTRMTQEFVLLLPKILVTGLILLAGIWLSQYLGRSALVWAVNEGIPQPRRIALGGSAGDHVRRRGGGRRTAQLRTERLPGGVHHPRGGRGTGGQPGPRPGRAGSGQALL